MTFSIDVALITIFILLAISIAIINIVQFSKLTREEQVEAILKVIKVEVIKLMADAELDWRHIEKAGEIKKAEVISKIYDKFPFLSKYMNQEELLKKISNIIENEKERMDSIINKDKESK